MENISNKKVARKVYPLEDEMSLHGGSDFEDQIDQLVGTNVKEQFEVEMEDELIKDIAHKFATLEQTWDQPSWQIFSTIY